MTAPTWDIVHGDCLDVLPTLAPASIHAVVTSPPYAMQRAKQYGGVPEAEYPAWTVAWMDALRPALAPGASVLVNIREHVKDGQISDYVHRTRLAVRAAGWAEIDELIWHKPDGPPVGHPGRPRRSWERVLWFAVDAKSVRCFPKANGVNSTRIGMAGGRRCYAASNSSGMANGVARCADIASVSTRANVDGVGHPAVYPPALASWLLRLVTEPGDMACDPFVGSGTTGIAALSEGRSFVGVEREAAYVDIARCRLADVQPALEGVA